MLDEFGRIEIKSVLLHEFGRKTKAFCFMSLQTKTSVISYMKQEEQQVSCYMSLEEK